MEKMRVKKFTLDQEEEINKFLSGPVQVLRDGFITEENNILVVYKDDSEQGFSAEDSVAILEGSLNTLFSQRLAAETTLRQAQAESESTNGGTARKDTASVNLGIQERNVEAIDKNIKTIRAIIADLQEGKFTI